MDIRSPDSERARTDVFARAVVRAEPGFPRVEPARRSRTVLDSDERICPERVTSRCRTRWNGGHATSPPARGRDHGRGPGEPAPPATGPHLLGHSRRRGGHRKAPGPAADAGGSRSPARRAQKLLTEDCGASSRPLANDSADRSCRAGDSLSLHSTAGMRPTSPTATGSPSSNSRPGHLAGAGATPAPVPTRRPRRLFDRHRSAHIIMTTSRSDGQ